MFQYCFLESLFHSFNNFFLIKMFSMLNFFKRRLLTVDGWVELTDVCLRLDLFWLFLFWVGAACDIGSFITGVTWGNDLNPACRWDFWKRLCLMGFVLQDWTLFRLPFTLTIIVSSAIIHPVANNPYAKTSHSILSLFSSFGFLFSIIGVRLLLLFEHNQTIITYDPLPSTP